MKNYKAYLIIFIISFLPFHLFSQKDLKVKKSEFKTENQEGLDEAWKSIKEGDKYFKAGRGTYREAREYYLFANKYNSENAELNYKIGVCYLFSDDKFETIKYFKKAFLIKESVSPDIRYLAGRAYHLINEFDKAIEQYSEYKETLAPKQLALEASRLNRLMEECENGKKLVADPLRVIISNVGEKINSEADDYNLVFSPDDSIVFFTSRRQHNEKSKRSPIDNKYFEDIYYASKDGEEIGTARNIGKPVNKKDHNTAAVGLSPDNTKLFIYRGYKGGGSLYASDWKGDKWAGPKKVSSNLNTKFMETSMALSPDFQTLYFISTNDKETFGGKDIFLARRSEKGKWQKPVNLGEDINSSYDEEAVSISPDGNTLYFSSRGRNTMGGYDIFKSVRNELGEWNPAENLGYPVNSPDDDLFYKVAPNSRYAYYSANRMGGLGGKDIFKVLFLGEEKEMVMKTEDILYAGLLKKEKTGFFMPPSVLPVDTSFVMVGKVYNSKTDEGVMAKLDFIDVEISKVVATAVANDTGYYLARLPEGKAYGVEIVAKDYMFFLDIVDISGEDPDMEIVRDFGLENVEVGAKVVLENIFFETGKATLKPESFAQLEQVLKFLSSNPSLRMEISGHTDNTGSQKVNAKLSQSRAESVVEYLVEHGVEAARLDAKGYDFSQPIAPNDSPEGRAKNRRVEFKILSK